MLCLTCNIIPSVDIARCYGTSCTKDWVFGKCSTMCFEEFHPFSFPFSLNKGLVKNSLQKFFFS